MSSEPSPDEGGTELIAGPGLATDALEEIFFHYLSQGNLAEAAECLTAEDAKLNWKIMRAAILKNCLGEEGYREYEGVDDIFLKLKLSSKKVKPEATWKVSQSTWKSIVLYLLMSRPEIAFIDDQHELLKLAAIFNLVGILEPLVQHEAFLVNDNLRQTLSDSMELAIGKSSEDGSHLPILKSFVSLGADVNKPDSGGMTPLALAIIPLSPEKLTNKTNVVTSMLDIIPMVGEMLAESSGEIKVLSSFASRIAVGESRLPIVRWLLEEAGANPNQVLWEGKDEASGAKRLLSLA